MPWQRHEDNLEAAKLREMSLPPEYRMAGNKRFLRDALLAVRLLDPKYAPLIQPGESGAAAIQRLLTRESKRAEMSERVTELRSRMSPQAIKEATDVANQLFSYQMDRARRAITEPKKNPRFKK